MGGETAGVLIVRPDHARRIDLPGAGPCPRPVDIDRARTGFAHLVSLRVYAFARGVAIDGEAEADELFIILMRGEAEIAVSSGGRAVAAFSLRHEGGLRAIYMPPNSSYHLSAVTDCDIAYARAAARGTRFPETRGFTPTGDRLDVVGLAVGMDLALVTVQAGQEVQATSPRLPERFVHVRSDGAASAALAGEPLDDWDSAALRAGENAGLKVKTGMVEVLTISASVGGTAGSKT